MNFDELSLRSVEFTSSLREEDRHPITKIDGAIDRALQTLHLPQRKRTIECLPELNAGLCGLIDDAFELKVMVRLASTAIALERHQQSCDNQYPLTLDALVPQFLRDHPIDPWLEDTLLYYRLRPGGRPAVWSAGENGQDDKGYVSFRNDSDDIVWQYERALEDSD